MNTKELGEFCWEEALQIDNIFCLDAVMGGGVSSSDDTLIDMFDGEDGIRGIQPSEFNKIKNALEYTDIQDALAEARLSGWIFCFSLAQRSDFSEDGESFSVSGGCRRVGEIYVKDLESLMSELQKWVKETSAEMRQESEPK